jgi:hypothetical protein
MKNLKQIAVMILALILVLVPGAAMAQTPLTNSAAVSLSFTIPTSVSINCTTPTFTVAGTTATSSTITCSSSWNLPSNYGTGICIAQYLTSATPFGAGGPSSGILSASANGGAAAAFPTTSGFPATNACQNAVQPSVGASFYGPNLFSSNTEALQGTHTDTDVITANLTGVAASTYTATLNFVIGVQ